MYKLTAPSGPWRNTTPREFSGENWKLMAVSGPSTFTPNETCASTWFSKKATFVQDLVRSQPVTRIISSICSIPSLRLRAKANQTSICFTIHCLKSSRERVSSHRADTGRDSTAAPPVPLCLNVTWGKSPGLRQYYQQRKVQSANYNHRE